MTRLDRQLLNRQRRAPHFFEVVKLTYFRLEDVNDNVAGVDQYPIAMRQAFNPAAPIAAFLYESDEMI